MEDNYLRGEEKKFLSAHRCIAREWKWIFTAN